MDRINEGSKRRTVSTNLDFDTCINKTNGQGYEKECLSSISCDSGEDDTLKLPSHHDVSKRKTGSKPMPNNSNNKQSTNSSGNEGVGFTTVSSACLPSGEKKVFRYSSKSKVGNGSFGVVYKVLGQQEPNETYAIKKVLQDERYKNRELQIIRTLNHASVCDLKFFYYSKSPTSSETYLHLVLEFIPENLNQVTRRYRYEKKNMPISLVKLYAYQIYRSLAYIHSKDICHRDIKPQNLLVDTRRGILKLCDFGSAKILSADEPNVSYICSRYYRAPELIFGSSYYTSQIDIWSAGCVFSELLTNESLFPGENGTQLLIKIIKTLGSPTKDDIACMNPEYTDFHYSKMPGTGLASTIPISVETKNDHTDLLQALSSSLVYKPKERLTAIQILTLPLFKEIKPTYMNDVNGHHKDLFTFSNEELRLANSEQQKAVLMS